MIEGLKVTIPGTDVRLLLEQRAAHHDKRAQHYREQATSLKNAGFEEEEQRSKFANSSNNQNPLRDAQDSVTRHENKARESRFLARYIDPGESFLLNEHDLERLGVLSSRWG